MKIPRSLKKPSSSRASLSTRFYNRVSIWAEKGELSWYEMVYLLLQASTMYQNAFKNTSVAQTKQALKPFFSPYLRENRNA